MTSLEVLFTPADFSSLPQRDLSATLCVVFDVLRATSTMVTALGNGAAALWPVEEIADALAIRRRQPGLLLAGERQGVRIGPDLTGGLSFDLGNSPREFVRETVQGKTIVMTTTNGTRAMHACRKAARTLAGSFLNLDATLQAIRESAPPALVVVCSGTLEQAAYEDVLAAGALCDLVWDQCQAAQIADSAQMARELFLGSRDLLRSVSSLSRNARRLLSKPELRADVAFCLQRDCCPLVASLGSDGLVRRESGRNA